MLLVRFILAAFVPIAALGTGVAVSLRPQLTLPLGVLSVAALALAIGFVIGRALRHPAHWPLLFLPAGFWATALFALLIVERAPVRYSVAAVSAFLLAFHAWNLLLYFHLPLRYRISGLLASAQGMTILTLFCLGADFSALITYLALPAWVGAAATLAVAGALVPVIFWTGKIHARRSLPMTVAAAAICAESFWVVTLLPVNPTVAGSALAFTAYLVTGLSRHVYLETATRRVAARYAAVTMLGLAMVLGTARWA